jgi:phosphoribosylformimino-5-aminoimidazole carboxamide ribotide isomerase
LCKTTKPLDLALGYREHLGLNLIYLADLDAIQINRPQHDVYKSLISAGFHLMIDAGLADITNGELIFGRYQVKAPELSIIVGLESVCGPNCLATLITRFGSDNVIFSVDMFGGEPMIPRGRWPDPHFASVVQAAYEVGTRRFILLELSRVGMESGLPMLAECEEMRKTYPGIEIIPGGGVRRPEDIRQAAKHGANGILLATALHKGEINKELIAEFAV